MAESRADMKYFDLVKKGKGRPRLLLNDAGIDLVQKLSAVACSDEEICQILEIDIKTMMNNADNRERYKKAKAKGFTLAKMGLRRAQFKAAERGNATMLIWLGRQYLDQTDKKEIKTEDSGNSKEIKIVVNPASSVNLEQDSDE